MKRRVDDSYKPLDPIITLASGRRSMRINRHHGLSTKHGLFFVTAPVTRSSGMRYESKNGGRHNACDQQCIQPALMQINHRSWVNCSNESIQLKWQCIMQYKNPVRIIPLIFYGVPVIYAASCFSNSAMAISPFEEIQDVGFTVSQTTNITRDISLDLSKAVNLQSDKRRKNKVTLQNIHDIKDMDIFGSELMTKSELAKFRIDLKRLKTQRQLEQYLAAHRVRIMERAENRGVLLE